MVLDNKSFAQKTLVVYGLCYVFYGATFMGETLGLEDAGAKYQGKKNCVTEGDRSAAVS